MSQETQSPERIYSGRVILQPVDFTRSGRREYECIFMQPGRVKQADQEPSNWLIPAQVIEDAAHLFNSISVHLDHPELFGFGWHQDPQVKNLAGVTFDARWSDEEQALLGGIRLYDQKPGSPGAFVGALMDQMLADQAKDLEIPKTGLSAVIFEKHRFDEETGLHITTAIDYAESIDFVYDAGAAGYVRAALSASGWAKPFRRVWNLSLGATPPPTILGGATMSMRSMSDNNTTLTPDGGEGTNVTPPAQSEPEQDPALDAITTLSAQVAQIATQIGAMSAQELETESEPDPVQTLSDEVERLTALVSKQEAATTVVGMGDAARLSGGLSSLDQVQAAVEAMIGGVRPPDRVRPLTGIRELYTMLSGDYAMTGLFQEDQVYLANVTSSTMAQMVANVLNKRVMNIFQEYPRWWEPFISEEDFATLQQIRWITLGGVGELPTVAEGAAYTELSWDDISQRTTFVKKGGYLGLTIEAMDKDDTRKLTAAPRALAQAAWLTLSRSISEIFTSNSGVGPNIYYDDTNTRALFHSSNSNLGTTALSWTAWNATRLAMRKQTELNSSERLGALVAPKFLLVPPDLEVTAIQLLASEGEPGTADNDENPWAEGDAHTARMRAARQHVIVVDLWTDTDNWAAVADPQMWQTIGVGYRYGRTPEVFSVADPRAGLMFTNDTMPIKVRFFYAAGPIDYRGLYKHNV